MFTSIFKISSFFTKGAATPAAPEDREQGIRALMAEFEDFPVDSVVNKTIDEVDVPATPSQHEKEVHPAAPTQQEKQINTRKQGNQPAADLVTAFTHTLAQMKAHSSIVVQGGRFALNELYKVATAPARIALSPVVAVAAFANAPINIGGNSLRTHYRMFGPMSVTYRYF